MPDECYLLVEKYDNSTLVSTLEQLGSRSSAYSIPLNDHPEFFKRSAASSLKSSQAIVVLFTLSYELAREEARNGFLDFLRILCRLDLGLSDYEDLLCFRTTWSTRLVLLFRS